MEISGLVVGGSVAFILIANWFTHVNMVTRNCYYWGWGSFGKFRKEFKKVIWVYDSSHRFSLSDAIDFSERRSYCHASIIVFDSKGMAIWNPISLMLVIAYTQLKVFKLRRESRKAKINRRVKW